MFKGETGSKSYLTR